MFSRIFTYMGYDNKEHKDTWWFNLSESELYKMEIGSVGGVNGLMNRLLRENEPGKVVDIFEKIILGAVGERSIDGRKFVKNEDIRQDFYQSPAYNELFMELVSKPDNFRNFLLACIPEELAAKIKELGQDEAPTEAVEDAADNADHLDPLDAVDDKSSDAK